MGEFLNSLLQTRCRSRQFKSDTEMKRERERLRWASGQRGGSDFGLRIFDTLYYFFFVVFLTSKKSVRMNYDHVIIKRDLTNY